MRKILISVGSVALFAMAGVMWFVYDVRSGYHELTHDAPAPLRVLVEDQKLIELRQEVNESKWRVHVVRDSSISDLLEDLGYCGSVEGVADLFAHHVEPFVWRDLEQNMFNMVVSTFRSAVMPRSSDGAFHLNASQDFGVVFVREGLAQFYADTEDGLVDGILTTIPNPSNTTTEDDQDSRSVIEILRKL